MMSIKSRKISLVLVGILFLIVGIGKAQAQWWNFWDHSQQNQNGQIIFNDVALNQDEVNSFQGMLSPGRYWYDPVSGLWGMEGGPSVGQLYPNLALGGPLRENASVPSGTTYVYVNGRELHPQEVYFLQSLYGSVIPGRYWLDANGNGGFEGGPAIYNLGAAMARGMGGGGGGYGGGSGGGGRLGHSVTGSVIGDGNTVGYIGTDGTGITCGPDGGCF